MYKLHTNVMATPTSNLLDNNEKKQIAKWIGHAVGFNLLYKGSRDGFKPEKFHKLCDNKGPTITVCWNSEGCVFGGYTSVNWFGGAKKSYLYDNNAFLFMLKYKNENKPRHFPIEFPQKALYYASSPTVWPSFGKDFNIFAGVSEDTDEETDEEETVSSTDDATEDETEVPAVTQLNSAATYHTGGLSMNEILDDDYDYTEIEVYQIGDKNLLTRPWRFDKQFGSYLRRCIEEYQPVENTRVKQARILLIGSVGAGKSSYVNTLISEFRGHVTSQANVGSDDHSLTTTYRMYQIRQGSGFLNVRLCDTRGMEDNEMGIVPGDITAMLDGHMPELYTYNPAAAITPTTPGYVKLPNFNDQIHCVALVVDGTSVDVMSESILAKFKTVQKLIKDRGIAIPQVILLTKIDRISLEVEEDLSSLFYCPQVEEVVEKVSQLIGLPRSHVLPVKNYEKESELDESIGRFAMLSLQQMLRFSDDYMYNMLDTGSI